MTVTAAGDTGTVYVDALPLTVSGNGIYTAIAVDSPNNMLPLQLILMDDLAP